MCGEKWNSDRKIAECIFKQSGHVAAFSLRVTLHPVTGIFL